MVATDRPRTEPRLAAAAGATRTARCDPGEDDEVADAQPAGVERGVRRTLREVRPELLDDRGAVVPQDEVRQPLPLPVDDVEVRVADARGDHPDGDLARAGRVEVERLELERPARRPEDRGDEWRLHRGCAGWRAIPASLSRFGRPPEHGPAGGRRRPCPSWSVRRSASCAAIQACRPRFYHPEW